MVISIQLCKQGLVYAALYKLTTAYVYLSSFVLTKKEATLRQGKGTASACCITTSRPYLPLPPLSGVSRTERGRAACLARPVD